MTHRSATDLESALQDQIAYYDARAAEDDDWYARRGIWDHGPNANAAWFRGIGVVKNALAEVCPQREVVDLACGSGVWTKELAQLAAHVVAVDASPRMIAEATVRLTEQPNVRFILADVLSWTPDRAFDLVFMGFWLSHVPDALLQRFLESLHNWTTPHGGVFLVDHESDERPSEANKQSSLGTHGLEHRDYGTRTFNVIKVPRPAATLSHAFETAGWRASLYSVSGDLVYGTCTLAQ